MSQVGRALAGASAFGLALAAWLAAPLHGPGSGRPLRIAIFDRSASVVRTRPDFEAWMQARAVAELESAKSAGSDFASLVFAGDRAWWMAPGSASREIGAAPRIGDLQESDLASALELARRGARESEARGGVVRLYTDGRASGLAVDASVRALSQAGLRIERGELAPPQLDDIAAVSLHAPRSLELGAPLACELRVKAEFSGDGDPVAVSSARPVRVEIESTSAGETRRLGFDRKLEAGEREASWRFDLGPAQAGSLRLRARVILDGDPIPENDLAATRVDVGGALEIAVVSGESDSSAARAASAFVNESDRWPGLLFAPTALEDLPEALGHVKALLTLDVEDSALPADLLRAFLAAGGGWLDASGAAALRGNPTSAAAPTGARALLPLWPDAPARPPRDVLLLIDGSGSMAGATFDALRAAALKLGDAVPPGDRLLLAFFTRELEPARVLRDAGAAGSAALDLAVLLRDRLPSGGTDVLGALEQLARSRAGEPRAMLALLLSDGRDPAAGAQRDLAALRARLAAARIELGVFAFGAEAELEFLTSLLPPGRELHRALDGRELSELLTRCVDSERTRENTAAVAADAQSFAPGSLAHEMAAALLAGAPHSLERAWIARASDDARVLWRSVEGDPLLALREQGRGVSAAFASLPVDGWASAARAPAALGPLLRALARGPVERKALPRAEIVDGTLWLRELPPGMPASVTARLETVGEVSLEPPTMLVDEPLTTRCAKLSSDLLAELARRAASCTVELRSIQGENLTSAALEPPPASEFTLPRVEISDSNPEATGALAVRRQSHPAAAWVLLASVGLLAAALLLGLGTR